MRISTRVVIDIETDEVIARESFEYEGPAFFFCGGDALAGQKQTAANQQIQEQQQLMDLFQNYQKQTSPFWTSRLQNGLPYFNQLTDYTSGTLAKSFAPVRAGLNRQLSGFGETLPSGMKEQLNTNLDAQEGEAFDQNQVQALSANENTKEAAAASLNPFQPAQLATGAGGSVLSAPPVQSGGVGNFLGGAVSGLFNNPGFGAALGGLI